jgi:hypothetical protein
MNRFQLALSQTTIAADPSRATVPLPTARPAPAAAKELSVAEVAGSAGGSASAIRPEQLNSEILTGPGTTKHATLTIQSNAQVAPLAIPKKNLELVR